MIICFFFNTERRERRNLHQFAAMQEILTELIVEWRCWGLLCFAGHRAGYTALAASLAIGCSSTLDSHGRLFVLCIFSRGVVPVFGKCQQSQQENAPGCWMVGSIKRDINFWAALWGTDNSLLKKKTKQNKGRVGVWFNSIMASVWNWNQVFYCRRTDYKHDLWWVLCRQSSSQNDDSRFLKKWFQIFIRDINFI